MISPAAALLALATVSFPCLTDGGPIPRTGSTEELEEAYSSGQPFADFLAAAEQRRELWEENYGNGEIDEALVERASAVGGTWYILAIAVAGCSDSVNTIPFVARLTELVPGLDMRIIDSTVGRELMEARLTPDGRAATPTLILLDENYDDAGCWIERPTPLQEWAMGEGADLDRRDFMTEKMGWYRDDAGHSTVAEVVGLLESASRGHHVCGT